MASTHVQHLKNDLTLVMKNKANLLYSDEFIVIIADAFPKSIYHYLVLPKEDIPEVRSLNEFHIPKLIYMELKGLEHVMRITGLTAKNLLVGYHAYPSMNRLHLHILSKDFRGSYLRKPFQWNSFHTEFFLSTYKIIAELSTIGHVVLPDKRCLNKPLQCNKCSFISVDILNLKTHFSMVHNEPY